MLMLMEIEFQNTKEDYLKFYQRYFKELLKSRFFLFLFLSLMIGFAIAGGKPSSGITFIIVVLGSLIVCSLLFYWILLRIAIQRFDKEALNNNSLLDKIKLKTTDEGIVAESIQKKSELLWQSVKSIVSYADCVIIEFVNQKKIFIPKRSFSTESDEINFLGIVQTRIVKSKGGLNSFSYGKVDKPPYLVGVLCAIPFVGALVGVILLFLGVLKYKSIKLSIIGGLGILWTILIYLYLTPFSIKERQSSAFKKNYIEMSQNKLVKDIEYFKIIHGKYPDSLKELLKENESAPIYDFSRKLDVNKGNQLYNYHKIGDKYTLFSSGLDGLINTKDDLFPLLDTIENTKIGYIHP